MKTKVIMSKLIFIALFVLVIASSCSRRELELFPAEGPVNITYNWANLGDGETQPKAMKLYFYGNGTVITRESDGVAFNGMIPNGTYQVIAYNTDAVGVSYDKLDTYVGAQALVPSATKAAYLSQPLHSYGVGLGNIVVMGDSVVTEAMKPVSFVKSVTLKYIVTGEKDAVKSCTGVLNGIAEAVNIVTGEPIGKVGTVGFTPTVTAEGYASTITFFGKENSSTNVLHSYFNFVGGGGQALDIDVSAAIEGVNAATIPIHIEAYIKVTGTLNGGGFKAKVSKWTSSNGEIIVE